jgi:outer membrane receptor protein involved in Fe transport
MRHGLAFALLLIPGTMAAQAAPDSARVDLLRPRVVTAERVRTPLGLTAASVTRLERAELTRMGGATIADVLRRAPGFTLVSTDGLGFDPQAMVRGFYGGGEAEYVVVLVDGRPVSQMQTGLVAWEALPPLASVEAVEIVRGGASAIHGDAAIGGVINIITRAGVARASAPAGRDVAMEASGGAHGNLRLAGDLSAPARGGALTASLGLDRTDGFRDHAARATGRAAVGWRRSRAPGSELAFSLRSNVRRFDEPGALLESLATADHRGSDTLFRFDHTRDVEHIATVEHVRLAGGSARWSASLLGAMRTAEATRTLALAPGFGDTKERRTRNVRLQGTAQLEFTELALPGDDALLVGAELGNGTLDSRHHEVAGGTRADYAASSGARGPLAASGEGARLTSALYAQYSLTLAEAWRLTLGARGDRLEDEFNLRAPGTGPTLTATHSAFSPKAGLAFNYLRSTDASGSAYASVNRSFKAPTFDQLYDQRSVPVPFPPFSITTSNPDLRAQHGIMYEAGLNHHLRLASGSLARYNVAAYQMDMRDELDFDVASFRYVNLGRSRHRGVEAGWALDSRRSSLSLAYTLQHAVNEQGANAGNRLKAIPLHSATAGLSFRPLRRAELLELSFLATHARDIFLDDANDRRLPDHTRVDARATFPILGMEGFVEASNLLDARYSVTGFMDPSGSGEAYLHPAAGRVIGLGVRRGF